MVLDLTFSYLDVNPEGLHEELLNACGGIFIGLSTGPYGVTVHLADDATSEQIAQAQAIVGAHNPEILTPEQQARINLFSTIKTTAQSAVGVQVNDLTAAQVKALLASLLYKAGAVASDGTIQPLDEWVQKQR